MAGAEKYSVDDEMWLGLDERHKWLAWDPEGNGRYRTPEAKSALEAERQGLVGRVDRSPVEDYVDDSGWVFDVKRPSNMTTDEAVEHILSDKALQRSHILADISDLAAEGKDVAAITARIRELIEYRGTKQGKNYHDVRFLPVELNK